MRFRELQRSARGADLCPRGSCFLPRSRGKVWGEAVLSRRMRRACRTVLACKPMRGASPGLEALNTPCNTEMLLPPSQPLPCRGRNQAARCAESKQGSYLFISIVFIPTFASCSFLPPILAHVPAGTYFHSPRSLSTLASPSQACVPAKFAQSLAPAFATPQDFSYAGACATAVLSRPRAMREAKAPETMRR